MNLTTDNSNSRNTKSPSGNYFVTEETKFAMKEKRKIKNRSKPRTSYLNTKKCKKKNSTNTTNKIKVNIPLKIPHKNSYHRPQMTFLGDIATDKNIYSPSIEVAEIKIAKKLQDIKNVEKETKFEKLKNICEEAIENFVGKEHQKLFYLMIKEFDNINKMNINDIKYLKNQKDELANKIKIIDNENNIYKLQLEQNNKEMASIKNQLKMTQTNYMNFPFKKNQNNKNIKYNNYKKNIYKNEEEDEEEENINLNTESNYSLKTINKSKRDNNYFLELNKKNLNDLDAIYFFDKIQNCNDANAKLNKNTGNKNNYKTNKGEVIPQLNLDPTYIEECKTKELLKMEEANLTPFQKIALQFEVS